MRVLDESPDARWVDWAVSLLERGVGSSTVSIIAGLRPPLEFFETRRLFDQSLRELGEPDLSREQVLRSYGEELIRSLVETPQVAPLAELAKLYEALQYPGDLRAFYLLHHAATDFRMFGEQYYLPDLEERDLEERILSEARSWLASERAA